MKLIKPSFEIIEQQPGLDGMFKQIELAGRTCYKSEDRITEDSAKKFVDRMINSGHHAVLEHGTVYMKIQSAFITDSKINLEWFEDVKKYEGNKYSRVMNSGIYAYITTNYRVLIENNWLDDLKYLCEPTKFHEKRVCVRFICDRGVSHEYVRHRVFSFAQESTRYCNYSKDKFGNEITCIIPSWLKIKEGNYDVQRGEDAWGNDTGPELLFNKYIVYSVDIPDIYNELLYFVNSLKEAETNYFHLLANGWTPQQARAVLPNALKTELVMTGFVSDWPHFFDLRCDPSAHPQARELAIQLREEFIERNFY